MNAPNNFLPDWLTRCTENHPQRLAVQCDQVQWSFAELDYQASRMARQLATSDVQEGSRIALLAANGLSYVTIIGACHDNVMSIMGYGGPERAAA